MVKVYYDSDVALNSVKEETIAVIGYGSQGYAQAQNMRDSGLHVIIGARQGGKSWEKAANDSFEVSTVSAAAKKGTIIHMLIPDLEQPTVYRDEIAPHLSEQTFFINF